jgi:4,4'-diaponeurosporenoate glycosyltransferase
MSVLALSVVVAGGWLAGWWLLWRLPGLDPANGMPTPETLAVIIPARNEAAALPVLLADLAAQRPRPAEIVVVDDDSDDDTAAIAAAAGATAVHVDGPPKGWAGKSWACWTGVQETTAPVLIFLDADVRLAPGALARLAITHRRLGGLLSVQPLHVTGRAVEGLSMGANIVTLAGSGAFTPHAADPDLAFGPCLVCTRRQYLAVGGHEAVKDAIAEDAALAHRFRRSRLLVTLRAGREAVSFRMYPRGLRPLLQGWTKNLATGAGIAPLGAALLTTLWIAGVLASVGAIAEAPRVGTLGAVAAVGIYAAVVGQVWWMARRVGRFGWWPVLVYPVPIAVFVALFAWSLVRTHLIGTVRWRGRRIDVRRQRA